VSLDYVVIIKCLIEYCTRGSCLVVLYCCV